MLDILRDLVNIPSPSGNEGELRDYVQDFLKERGFDPGIDEAGNLFLEGESDLWFVTHLDTVEKLAEFRTDGDFVYGTGVADAKGSIAAMLSALSNFDDLGVGYAFLVDEEEGGTGSRYFAEKFSGKAVIMEPTELKTAFKQLGSAEVILRFHGRSVHGAYFDRGENAVEKAIYVIMQLRKRYSFSVQEFRGGGNLYAVPDRCTVRLSFIFDSEMDIEMMREDLKSLDAEFEFFDLYEPVELDTVEEIEKYSRGRMIMHSWTDAYHFKKNGWKVTVWGPGSLVECHTVRERISIREIKEASEIIESINREVIG